jgi:hypothetical protein
MLFSLANVSDQLGRSFPDFGWVDGLKFSVLAMGVVGFLLALAWLWLVLLVLLLPFRFPPLFEFLSHFNDECWPPPLLFCFCVEKFSMSNEPALQFLYLLLYLEHRFRTNSLIMSAPKYL